jgi:triosephosphate isomerase
MIEVNMSGQDTLILGNWKMHFTVKQAVTYAQKLAEKTVPEGTVVGITPHTLALSEIATMLQKEKSPLKVIAQNAFHKDEGAFTGEVSMPMLRGLAEYVLVGHSERRHVLRESNDFIREKNAAALRSGITPVFCIGETLVERQHYHTNQVLSDQITLGLADLTAEEVASIIIAYEPVWAIGTGEYASPEDVKKAVDKIRAEVTSLYGPVTGASVRILYGGSVTKENAQSYLALPGVSGLLVGGASISLSKFWPIVEIAGRLHKKQKKIAVIEKRSA